MGGLNVKLLMCDFGVTLKIKPLFDKQATYCNNGHGLNQTLVYKGAGPSTWAFPPVSRPDPVRSVSFRFVPIVPISASAQSRRCVPISTPNRRFDRSDRTYSRSEVPAGAGTGQRCGGRKGAPKRSVPRLRRGPNPDSEER